jgi:hypothetical protein
VVSAILGVSIGCHRVRRDETVRKKLGLMLVTICVFLSLALGLQSGGRISQFTRSSEPAAVPVLCDIDGGGSST